MVGTAAATTVGTDITTIIGAKYLIDRNLKKIR